jgi:hypothetical protein
VLCPPEQRHHGLASPFATHGCHRSASLRSSTQPYHPSEDGFRRSRSTLHEGHAKNYALKSRKPIYASMAQPGLISSSQICMTGKSPASWRSGKSVAVLPPPLSSAPSHRTSRGRAEQIGRECAVRCDCFIQDMNTRYRSRGLGGHTEFLITVETSEELYPPVLDVDVYLFATRYTFVHIESTCFL